MPTKPQKSAAVHLGGGGLQNVAETPPIPDASRAFGPKGSQFHARDPSSWQLRGASLEKAHPEVVCSARCISVVFTFINRLWSCLKFQPGKVSFALEQHCRSVGLASSGSVSIPIFDFITRRNSNDSSVVHFQRERERERELMRMMRCLPLSAFHRLPASGWRGAGVLVAAT